MIFDTHAHYDDEAFQEDRDRLLMSLKDNDIGAVINVAADMESVETTLALSQKYSFVYAALGVHPSGTAALTEEDMQHILTLATEHSVKSGGKVVAIGEIGLDYYYEGNGDPERTIQKKWFERQLFLAKEAALPVIIHSRDAARDTYDIMKSADAGNIGGVVHCYSYSLEMAKNFLSLGFSFGIGGVLTFKNARKLFDVVEYLPMDKILLETDCPYLAPVPNRGKRNSSLNLPYVIKAISEIKKLPEEQITAATEQNARKLFGIKE